MARADDAWFESEQPLRRGVVLELQRLKRRARPRWPIVLLVAAALTAGVMYRISKKPKLYRAQVVLAVLEGSMASRRQPVPLSELRDYVASVLLNAREMLALIEEKDLFPLRHRLGDEYALTELWDLLDVNVFRNFFLYDFSADAPRSARIMLRVTHPDPDFAWELVSRIADIVIEGERRRREAAAVELAAEARRALAEANRLAAEIEQRRATLRPELTAADARGDAGQAAALRYQIWQLDRELRNANERIRYLTQQTNAEELAAEVTRAGLGLQFVVADERRPQRDDDSTLYVRIILGGVVFCVLLPVVAVFIGAFDTRVHDREDLARLGIPVLGHLPGFPGDGVGSLRRRGLRGGRVPS